MIQGYGPVMQAFLGTLFTWGLTALGAALVLIIRGSQRKLLDASLGFAAGVMTAASYWSLLGPAIEMAIESKIYGENGEFAFAPVGLGFLLGAFFVYGTDVLISVLGVHSPNMMLALHATSNRKDRRDSARRDSHISSPDSTAIDGFNELGVTVHQRRRGFQELRWIQDCEISYNTDPYFIADSEADKLVLLSSPNDVGTVNMKRSYM